MVAATLLFGDGRRFSAVDRIRGTVRWTGQAGRHMLSDIVRQRSGDARVATERLSIRIDAGLMRRLEEEARRGRRSASWLAVEAIEALLRARAEKRAAIRAAVAEADRGAFISRAAMDEWVSSWDSEPEEPPEPDIGPAPG